MNERSFAFRAPVAYAVRVVRKPGAASRELLDYLDELEAVVAGDANRRGETRERLIDAAILSFRASGFAATSVRAVSKEVGITAAALYSHFASKQELLGVAVAAAQLRFLRAVLAPEDGASPASARLEGIVRRHMRYELETHGRVSWFDLLLGNDNDLGLLDPEDAARSLRMHDLHLAELEYALRHLGGGGTRLEAEFILRICESSPLIVKSLGGDADAVIERSIIAIRRLAAVPDDPLG